MKVKCLSLRTAAVSTAGHSCVQVCKMTSGQTCALCKCTSLAYLITRECRPEIKSLAADGHTCASVHQHICKCASRAHLTHFNTWSLMCASLTHTRSYLAPLVNLVCKRWSRTWNYQTEGAVNQFTDACERLDFDAIMFAPCVYLIVCT